jgi:hypothetical protein
VDDHSVFVPEKKLHPAIKTEQVIEVGGADFHAQEAILLERGVDADELMAALIHGDGAAIKLLGKWGGTNEEKDGGSQCAKDD